MAIIEGTDKTKPPNVFCDRKTCGKQPMVPCEPVCDTHGYICQSCNTRVYLQQPLLFGGWKDIGHTWPTLLRLARRIMTIANRIGLVGIVIIAAGLVLSQNILIPVGAAALFLSVALGCWIGMGLVYLNELFPEEPQPFFIWRAAIRSVICTFIIPACIAFSLVPLILGFQEDPVGDFYGVIMPAVEEKMGEIGHITLKEVFTLPSPTAGGAQEIPSRQDIMNALFDLFAVLSSLTLLEIGAWYINVHRWKNQATRPDIHLR